MSHSPYGHRDRSKSVIPLQYQHLDSLPLYYSEYFADKEEERRKLFEKLKYDIETIIKDFLNSIGSDKLYMDTPPELEGLSNRK